MKTNELIETSWTTKGQNYVRVFDKTLNKSKIKATPHKSIYYEESAHGKFSYILDPSVKLALREGSSYKNPNAYGSQKAEYVAIREEYQKFNIDTNVWYLDIETKVTLDEFPNPKHAKEELSLIQILDKKTKTIKIIGYEKWYNQEDYQKEYQKHQIEFKDIEYIQVEDERAMFRKYFELFAQMDPYIIYAWNGSGFDFPYLFNRAQKLGISVELFSNYPGKVKLKEDEFKGLYTADIVANGHLYSDLADVYRKFVFDTVSSYSLMNIGQKETGISKVSHENYLKFDDFRIGKYKILGDETEEHKKLPVHRLAQTLEDNPNHPKKDQILEKIRQISYSEFVNYGIYDVIILQKIDEARNFTGVLMGLGELFGCLPSDALGTIKPWSQFVTKQALERNLVLPPHQDNNADGIIGGYVAPPRVGKAKWILSADINSAYPLLGMVAGNMSPETFVEIHKRPIEMQDHILKYFNDQDEGRVLELSPEVKAETTRLLQKYNYSLGLNGAIFTREFEGLIPTIVRGVYGNRKAAKKRMFVQDQIAVNIKEELHHPKDDSDISNLKRLLEEALHSMQLDDTLQMTLKIAMNSLYGAIANQYFALFNEAFAAAITMNSRYFVRLMSNRIVQKLEDLTGEDCGLYNDTDSFYFTIDPVIGQMVQKGKLKTLEEKIDFTDKFYDKIIDPVVQKAIDDFAVFTNSMDKSVIGAEREVVADSGLFIAKKKYALRVRDNEGTRYPLDDPYMKSVGLDIKQGGIAKFSKVELEGALGLILDKESKEIKEWVLTVRDKYTQADIADVAKTIGVSKVQDPNWGKIINGRKVAVPFGSRACVATNEYLIREGLQGQFPLLAPGNKVKIWYLTVPNPLHSDVFASDDPNFAKRFEKYIDKDMNFEKFFMSPLKNMVDCLGIDFSHNVEEVDVW